ncbi:hypothetical protein MAP00_006061 [Monascus purpureus]|nr:hypothetical protein MAP00_006061 [Monascus purpureus]
MINAPTNETPRAAHQRYRGVLNRLRLARSHSSSPSSAGIVWPFSNSTNAANSSPALSLTAELSPSSSSCLDRNPKRHGNGMGAEGPWMMESWFGGILRSLVS